MLTKKILKVVGGKTLGSGRLAFFSSAPRNPADPNNYSWMEPVRIKRRGLGVVHDPWSNKGTGFPLAERDRLRIRGLVPPRTLTLEVQAEKILSAINEKGTPLEKNTFLADLQDRNETLYFRLLIDNLEQLAPIVYTPTVGLACQRFGSVFRRARGMYFSSQDRGMLSTMVYNWPHDQVEVIVVTDGSRILGLGALAAMGLLRLPSSCTLTTSHPSIPCPHCMLPKPHPTQPNSHTKR